MAGSLKIFILIMIFLTNISWCQDAEIDNEWAPKISIKSIPVSKNHPGSVEEFCKFKQEETLSILEQVEETEVVFWVVMSESHECNYFFFKEPFFGNSVLSTFSKSVLIEEENFFKIPISPNHNEFNVKFTLKKAAGWPYVIAETPNYPISIGSIPLSERYDFGTKVKLVSRTLHLKDMEQPFFMVNEKSSFSGVTGLAFQFKYFVRYSYFNLDYRGNDTHAVEDGLLTLGFSDTGEISWTWNPKGRLEWPPPWPTNELALPARLVWGSSESMK